MSACCWVVRQKEEHYEKSARVFSYVDNRGHLSYGKHGSWKNITAATAEKNINSEILSTGEKHATDRFAQSVMDKIRYLWISSYLKRNRMWKKLFFWLQGPGDIKTKTVSLLYRNKKTVFGGA